MKRKSIFLFTILLFLVGLIYPVNRVSAAADKSYSVQAVLPDNQIDKNESYFDLKVEPNKDQDLKVMIINTGSEPIKVKAEVNDAYTADSGVIGYDKYNVKLFKNQNPSLSSLVEGKRKTSVNLKVGQAKTVSFKVKSPANEYTGIILGGVTTTANVSPTKSKNINIKNQVRYVKGVVLRSKDDGVVPDMHMTNAKPKSVAGNSGIAYTLDNSAPININEVTLSAKIYHNSDTTKYSAKNLQIAPNSKFDYFIPVKDLSAGKYKGVITVKSKAGYEKTFTRTISVSKSDVDYISEQAEQKVSRKSNQWIIIIVGIVALILVALWMFLYYSQRNNKTGSHGKRTRSRR
ncbi:DUF916 domain-containing protein [Companilactobacillus insicii]|uniref:DUF916 domain-containing protein n=1 Tax=Companilactobacillus insicii TaxID=1732567 RepID=UPI000F7A7E97|nr:DUF916 domain-containing protein [Companilactobacillus insicii]